VRAAKTTVFADLCLGSANGAAPLTSPSRKPSGTVRKADATVVISHVLRILGDARRRSAHHS
jgi:hypothetical protein